MDISTSEIDLDSLTRQIMEGLRDHPENQALRDPRVVAWLAAAAERETLVTGQQLSSRALRDAEWLARGLALRDAVTRRTPLPQEDLDDGPDVEHE